MVWLTKLSHSSRWKAAHSLYAKCNYNKTSNYLQNRCIEGFKYGCNEGSSEPKILFWIRLNQNAVHKLCWAPFNIIKMKFQCQTSPSLWQHKLLVWYKYVVIAIMYGVNMVTNITNVQYKCCPKVSFDCKWSSKNLLYANIMVATPNMLMFYFWVHLDPHLTFEHLIQYSCWVWASILGLKPNIWFKNGTESSSEIICMATSL